ncbi:MAG: radical SAM protein, partial [Planctomycetota bacterium]
TENYNKVNEKALAKRAEEQAKKEKEAEKAKKAAEGVKKEKVKPGPQKKKLTAKPKKKAAPVQKKKKAKPTLKGPKRKKTGAVLSKKETEKLAEEIKPSAIRAGVEVGTPDGKGRVVDSPQQGQWNILMLDGWAKGENLIFAESEIKTGKKDVKARLGKVVHKTYEEGVKSAKSRDNILVQKGDTQGKYLLIQLKSREKAVTNEDKTYDKVYDNREGYERPADFWEIPMWMGEAANTFEDSDIYIIRNIDKAIDELNKAGYPTIMFSVLDANKAKIKQIASKYKGKVVVGGYIDPKYFAGLNNVTFYDTVKQAAEALGEKYKPGVSYVHFKDTETVPRLCLSKGCKHKCAFCVVPKTILTSTKDHIANQLKAFKNLKFKLIYIDDKTFGQADNYTDLVEVNKQIKKFNPEFEGFIIQTTAPSFLKMTDQFVQDSGIQYIELGVESYNDDILSKVRKPHRTKQLDKAVIKIRKNGKAFIPNILVGLTGKGWSETIYNLALYEGTELHEQLKDKADTEMDENVVTRAYHKEKDIHEEFYKRVLGISSDALDLNPIQPISLVRYMKTGTVKTMNPEVLTHRTGIQGEELKRLRDDPDAPNRLHYYIEGGPEEAHIASLPFKYRAEVPAGRFYDTMSDPLNLRQLAKREGMAQADANLAEKIMKDHGYIGYYSQDRGPAIAVVFDKLKVTLIGEGDTKARSSESYAKEAKAKQGNKFVSIIRRAFPTATDIRPAQGFIAGYEVDADDSFHVVLPNGARIQVKFNAMPELTQEQMDKFRNDYLGVQDITGQVPFALWVEDADASITGSGTVWLAGLGDLQTDLDHE